MKAKDAIPLLARRIQQLEERVAAIEADDDNVEVDDPFPDAGPATTKPEPWAFKEVGGNVIFNPPDDRLRAAREKLAPSIGFEHWTYGDPQVGGEGSPPLPVDEAIDAYVRGGPAWLLHYDRHFVMSLPHAARQAFVEDIAYQSPEQGHEVARDILYEEQDSTSAGAGTISVEEANFNPEAETRPGTSYGTESG